MSAEQITVEDGKYTVIFDNGQLHALRYGERWRDLSGDKLIYALMCRIQALEAAASACLSHPAGSDQQQCLSITGEQRLWAAAQIMEQAQVFASSWSLVGGIFDMGNAMQDAEAAKQELREMVDQVITNLVEREQELQRLRAILALRQQAVPMTERWRLLNTGERIESGDECLQDDCVTWEPLCGWEVGMTYNPHVLVPLRRRIEAHHGITAQGAQGGEG